MATFSTSSLAPARHSITAVYSGDALNLADFWSPDPGSSARYQETSVLERKSGVLRELLDQRMYALALGYDRATLRLHRTGKAVSRSGAVSIQLDHKFVLSELVCDVRSMELGTLRALAPVRKDGKLSSQFVNPLASRTTQPKVSAFTAESTGREAQFFQLSADLAETLTRSPATGSAAFTWSVTSWT